MVETLWKVFLVAIIVACLVATIYYYLNEEIQTSELETKIIYSKLLYTNDCLAFNDSIRIRPNLVDFNKLDQIWLQNCKINDLYSVRITLLNSRGEPIKPPKSNTNSLIINPKYVHLIDVCKSTSNFECYYKSSFVHYMMNGEEKPGFIDIEVIKNVQ